MTYPIKTVPVDVHNQLEQLGTKAKFWYRDNHDFKVLFKEGRPGTGENWAEKVCCEICRILNLPHAYYDLAICGQRKGVITPTFVPKNARLIHGNEWLSIVIKEYSGAKQYGNSDHTVTRVMELLSYDGIKLPLNWNVIGGIVNAADLFVGYIMLDALVSNQDRHDQNWGMIVDSEKNVYFAPTFDHASSLGRNESDSVRLERLSTSDSGRNIKAYVKRARSALYENTSSTKPLTTLEAFYKVSQIRPDAGLLWKERLERITIEEFKEVFNEIPDSEISTPARDFALKIIETNASRIYSL